MFKRAPKARTAALQVPPAMLGDRSAGLEMNPAVLGKEREDKAQTKGTEESPSQGKSTG